MRAGRVLSVLGWVAVVVAGCVGEVAQPDDGSGERSMRGAPVVPPDHDFASAVTVTHDHEDPGLHGAAFGLRLVGFDPLTGASRPGTLPGGHTEVSLAGDWAVVANFGPHRGFSVVDVSDPSAPRHVSDFLSSDPLDPFRFGAQSDWDANLFPDGDLVVLSAQALANLPTAPDEVGGGLYLVNISDKARPVMESFTQVVDPEAAVPVGVHNARGFVHPDGRLFVAASTANGETFVYEVVGEAPARTLRFASNVPGMHDTAVQVHPLTGRLLLYGAQGGVYVTDITDPDAPEILSFVPNGEDGLSAYHQVVPNDVLMDGRHFVVAATESTSGLPTPFTILDTTDPTAPKVVGQWRLPISVPTPADAPYRWSGHNLDVTEGRMFIGHYHAGVWVIDFTDIANGTAPFPLAHFEPAEKVLSVPRTPLGADVPAVWSVVRHTDGHIYAADINTGLYVLEFTGQPSPWAGAEAWPDNTR